YSVSRRCCRTSILTFGTPARRYWSGPGRGSVRSLLAKSGSVQASSTRRRSSDACPSVFGRSAFCVPFRYQAGLGSGLAIDDQEAGSTMRERASQNPIDGLDIFDLLGARAEPLGNAPQVQIRVVEIHPDKLGGLHRRAYDVTPQVLQQPI